MLIEERPSDIKVLVCGRGGATVPARTMKSKIEVSI